MSYTLGVEFRGLETPPRVCLSVIHMLLPVGSLSPDYVGEHWESP